MLLQLQAVIALFMSGLGLGVLILVLHSQQQTGMARYFLASFIALNSVCFVLEYCRYSQIILPGNIGLLENLALFEGALFYLYVKALVEPKFSLYWRHTLHLLPALILMTPVVASSVAGLEGLIYLPIVSYYLLVVGYFMASLSLLPSQHRSFQASKPEDDPFNARWLYTLIVIYIGSSVIFLIGRVLQIVGMVDGVVCNTVVFIAFFYLIVRRYCYLNPPKTSMFRPAETDSLVDRPEPVVVKYKCSALSSEQSQDIWVELNRYMTTRKPFLNSELTLQQLAEGIGVSPYRLSQIINTESNRNFYDYINQARVDYARKLIVSESSSKMAMLDIGIESGFASKTTFYKYFKKCFSQTPNQYKNLQLQQINGL